LAIVAVQKCPENPGQLSLSSVAAVV
jgi:hypothetical protein